MKESLNVDELAGLPVDCADFRRSAGADPGRLSRAAAAHAAGCQDCAAHLRELQALDLTLLEALRVPVPAAATNLSRFPLRAGPAARPRWAALAASVLGGVAIGALLWATAPRSSLAEALVEHMSHEPEAMLRSATPSPALAEVLERGGVRLRAGTGAGTGLGTISYASSCDFRGHTVPHLVVQTERGPVTVLVLRAEAPAGRQGFELDGHRGTILPVGPGSVAVLGLDREVDRPFIDRVAAEVAAALEWQPRT